MMKPFSPAQLRYPLIALFLISALLALHKMNVNTSSTLAEKKIELISITQNGFLPREISCRSGDVISLTVVNTDKQPHNLVVEGLEVHTAKLPAGQSVTLQFTAKKKGRFPFVSNAPGFPEPGFRGTLIIE